MPSGTIRLQFSGGANGEVEIDDVDEHERITLVVHASGSGMEIDVEEREGGPESQLEGKIASVNAGAHTFVINGITVSVPGSASIAHGSRSLTFSDLVVGARVHVKGSKTGSTITATRIEVQQSGGPGPGNGNGNGGNGNGNGNGGDDNDDNDDNPGLPRRWNSRARSAALAAACPALTFAAAGRSVTTTSSTNFRTGLLRNPQRAESGSEGHGHRQRAGDGDPHQVRRLISPLTCARRGSTLGDARPRGPRRSAGAADSPQRRDTRDPSPVGDCPARTAGHRRAPRRRRAQPRRGPARRTTTPTIVVDGDEVEIVNFVGGG